MSFWSKPSTTTALLAVIAVLLFVQVVQTAAKSKPASKAAEAPEMPLQGSGALPPGHPPLSGKPAGGSGAPAEASGADMDTVQMILASMSCPEDASVTLDDPGCKGREAENRRTAVEKVTKTADGLRAIYDAVVAKFGEGSLTAQAAAIRRARIEAEKGN